MRNPRIPGILILVGLGAVTAIQAQSNQLLIASTPPPSLAVCQAPETFGATLTGTFVAFAACFNVTTGDLAIAAVNPDNASWDCEAAGLSSIPGDTIEAIGIGGVLGTDPVGGSLSGVTPLAALCDNLTVPQSVIVPIPPGDTAWDCEAAGLSVSPGDLVRMIGVGTAD